MPLEYWLIRLFIRATRIKKQLYEKKKKKNNRWFASTTWFRFVHYCYFWEWWLIIVSQDPFSTSTAVSTDHTILTLYFPQIDLYAHYIDQHCLLQWMNYWYTIRLLLMNNWHFLDGFRKISPFANLFIQTVLLETNFRIKLVDQSDGKERVLLFHIQ